MQTPRHKLDPPIIGTSDAMESVVRLIARLATSEVNVLITGESGTGKELVARNLHSCGPKKTKPFVAVNCAALNPGILESELFGHGRGSFTGAVTPHAGLFEQADGGTLFLDEIGELPLFAQAKMLRVIQDREVRRMGSAAVRRVSIRILCATNTELEREVREGRFRLDLFYRVNVVRVHLAPLRERAADLVDLTDFFFASRGLLPPTLSKQAREALFRYHWPGNVRELQNELDRMVALYPGLTEIKTSMLSERIANGNARERPFDVRLLSDTPLPEAVGYLEENLLRKTLEKTNWNKSKSARELGLSRQGLLKKIKRYGITGRARDLTS
ncbi:MAG: sigma-54 dependent transcriptional regulator [Candidatus Krumholzibacteria bacterium]|nr:sigma-54 dependent transcriptional regulator [Candidatus Krumholzibacteria bacterium]